MRMTEFLIEKDDINLYNNSNNNSNNDSNNNSSNDSNKSYSFICHSYGQNNFEKSIAILSILIIYTSILINHYYTHLINLIFIPLIISTLINVISLGIYGYFLKKLQGLNIFDSLPNILVKINNGIILINSLNEIFIIISMFFSLKIDWMCYILFFIRFLIETYFFSLKIFIFCPNLRFIQDLFEKIIKSIKSYIYDSQIEKEDYKLLDDYESSYYYA